MKSITTGRAGSLRKVPKRDHELEYKHEAQASGSLPPRLSLTHSLALRACKERPSLIGSHQRSWWFTEVNDEMTKTLEAFILGCFEHLNFRVLDLFGISKFGFRILVQVWLAIHFPLGQASCLTRFFITRSTRSVRTTMRCRPATRRRSLQPSQSLRRVSSLAASQRAQASRSSCHLRI